MRKAWFYPSGKAALLASLVVNLCSAQNAVCLKGHIYEFYTTVGLDWAKASKYANTLSKCGVKGHLVTITDAEEQMYVDQLVSSAEYMGKVWLGISSKKTNAPFKWVTGEPPVYTNWDESHSARSVGNTCAVLDPMSGGKWRDEWCKAPAGAQPANYNFPFIIEYDCATTVCGTVPEAVAVTEAAGPVCKGKEDRCWVDTDCCEGFACKGGTFKYCKKKK